jgi:hypothetical protein
LKMICPEMVDMPHIPKHLIPRTHQMLKYCSLCDRSVILNAEGLCPGCRQVGFLNEIPPEALAARAILRIAVLRGHVKLPCICPFCGAPASASSVVTWSRRSPHATDESGVAMLRAGFIGLLLDRLFRPCDQVISFRLPRCADCCAKNLEVCKIEWDDYSLQAYCHPNFCEAIEDHAKMPAGS